MRISLLQTDIIDRDTLKNLQHLNEIFPKGSDLVVLPEMFHCGFLKNMSFVTKEDGENAVQWLKEKATTHQTTVCGGVAMREKEELFNRFFVENCKNDPQYYDKKHLFVGGEKKDFTGGTEQLLFQVNDFKIRPIICYDLRFPVWCRQQQEKYDLLLCVANWPKSRMDTFHTLLKARAIENQAYVAAVNRVGESEGVKYSGGSVIFDPLGRVVAKAQTDQEEIITADLDIQLLNKYRKDFPVLQDMDKFKIIG